MGSRSLMGRRSVWPLVACVVLLVGLCSATDLRTSNGQTDSGTAAVVGAQTGRGDGGKEPREAASALPTGQQQQQQQQADRDPQQATDKGKDGDKHRRHHDGDKKQKKTSHHHRRHNKPAADSDAADNSAPPVQSDDTLPANAANLRSLRRTLHASDCSVLRKGSIKTMCVLKALGGSQALVLVREKPFDEDEHAKGAILEERDRYRLLAAHGHIRRVMVSLNEEVGVFRLQADVGGGGEVFYAWGMLEDYIDSGDPMVDQAYKLGSNMLSKLPYIWCELRRDASGNRINPKTFDELTAEDKCSRDKMDHTIDSLSALREAGLHQVAIKDFQVVVKADGSLLLMDPEGIGGDYVDQLQTLAALMQRVTAVRDRLYPPAVPPKKAKKSFLSRLFGGMAVDTNALMAPRT